MQGLSHPSVAQPGALIWHGNVADAARHDRGIAVGQTKRAKGQMGEPPGHHALPDSIVVGGCTVAKVVDRRILHASHVHQPARQYD
jgi:hypothetical protein